MRAYVCDGLILVFIGCFVSFTYLAYPEFYRNLHTEKNHMAVLTMLAIGIATWLGAVRIVVSQRSIVIQPNGPGHKELMDRINGGRTHLIRRMNAVSLLGGGMPLVAVFEAISVADTSQIFLGLFPADVAFMIALFWFCCLVAAVVRLEYTVVKALDSFCNQ